MPEVNDQDRSREKLNALIAEVPPDQIGAALTALKRIVSSSSSGLTKENCRASVFVLYTGGTIGMVPSEPGNPASPLVPGDKDQIEKYVPGLGEKHGVFWYVEGLPDEKPLDSSDVNSTHWKKMVRVIQKEYDNWDGFVILHGTDTMAVTASALSFMFRNLAKPVVITGAQLPIFDERTDGRLNLSNAIQIAGYKATGLPRIPEVVLCFGNALLRGNRSRKDSTSDLNGFISPNYPPLGTLGEYISINTSLLLPVPDEKRSKFSIETSLGHGVMDISLFPGLEAEALAAALDSKAVKGVILRTFGAGNAMNDDKIHKVLRKAVSDGKPVLNVTQCLRGMVEMGLYANSSALLEMGVISGLDMTPEAALTKMLWLLGTESQDDTTEALLQLQINQRGEQSESLFDVRYGPKGTAENSEATYKTSALPGGLFIKEKLKRAVLRISGLNFESGAGAPYDLAVFVSHPEADASSDPSDPRCAVRFRGNHEPGNMLIAEVTTAIDQFAEAGRRINLTVISRNQAKFWYNGLYLALFAIQ